MAKILDNKPVWLGSDVGLVVKTIELPADFATYEEVVDADGLTHKIVRSGTYVSTPLKGFVFNDADITSGARIVSLMIRGSYIDANLPATAASVAVALATQGLYAIAYTATTRPDFGSNTVAFEEIQNLYKVEIVSAKAVLSDAKEVEIVDNALTLTVGDVLSYVEVIANTFLTLEGTPKSIVTIGGVEYDHGLITVDGTNKKLVKVTPTGSNGTVGSAGTFPIKVLANSVKTEVGVGNDQIVITLTAVSAD